MPRVLIVEDEEYLCNMMADQASIIGFQVDVATDAEAALQFTDKDDYDVIVTDIRLPKVNGIDMMEKILSKSKVPTKFLVFSGYSDFSPEAVHSKGAHGFFEKPEGIFSLMEKLEEFVKAS